MTKQVCSSESYFQIRKFFNVFRSKLSTRIYLFEYFDSTKRILENIKKEENKSNKINKLSTEK